MTPSSAPFLRELELLRARLLAAPEAGRLVQMTDTPERRAAYCLALIKSVERKLAKIAACQDFIVAAAPHVAAAMGAEPDEIPLERIEALFGEIRQLCEGDGHHVRAPSLDDLERYASGPGAQREMRRAWAERAATLRRMLDT